MQIIGITGIIGAGKSTVAQILKKDYKLLIIDADKIGHELLAKDAEIGKKVIAAFGTNQRDKLAKIVFKNPNALKTLNKITHPAIRKKVKELIQLNPEEKQIVIDAALLFTIKLNKYCTSIIFVDAPPERIIARLLVKGLTKSEIDLRLRANASVLKLQKYCQVIINNNGTKKDLIRNTRAVFNKIII